MLPPWVCLSLRPRPGYWEHLRINVDEMIVEELTVSDYLSHKECLVDKNRYLSSKLDLFSSLMHLFLDVDLGSTFCKFFPALLLE